METSLTNVESQPAVFMRQATGLVRELSWFDTFIVVFAILNVPLGLAEVSAYAPGLFPGANMALAFILSAPAMLTLGMVYALFTAAMPRSGGDYVWASRILHPAVGFAVNFFVTFILLASAGLNSYLMATWFLPPVLYIMGLGDAAAWCATQTGGLVVGTVVTLLLLGVFLLGLRRVRQIMFGLFVFILAGTIFWMILLFFSSHSDFVSLFNASQGDGAYQKVVSDGAAAGYKVLSSALLYNTFAGCIYAFQSYNGFQNSGYFGGEIKQVNRSAIRAMLVALIAGGIGFSLGILAINNYYGSDFIGATSSLGLSVGKLPFPAVLPTLGLFVTNSPFIHLIIALTFLAAIFWIQPPAVLIGTRNLFSWAFDRVMPDGLASVSDRIHSPVIATIVVAVIIEIFTYVTIYTSFWGQLIALAGFSALVGVIISVAAIIFPFRRPDIFDRAPGIVRARLFGFPGVSIWGILSLIVTGTLCYIAFTSPAFGGGQFNTGVLYSALGLIVPFVLYYLSRLLNRQRKLDIAKAYQEIPPE
jgi:amino acid transporter